MPLRYSTCPYAGAGGGVRPTFVGTMAETGILGISIMAAMKNPKASVVSKMPWSEGQIAASRVIVMMAAAGRTMPEIASQNPMRVTARTAMMANATPPEITLVRCGRPTDKEAAKLLGCDRRTLKRNIEELAFDSPSNPEKE